MTKIKRTPNADTRSIEKPNKELVHKDTINHIWAVKDVMYDFAEMLKQRVEHHDHTKIGHHFDDFYECIASGKKGDEFYKLDWWQLHITERHHLNHRCPDDVNMIDVIEMIVDCVSAGMARTGEVYPIAISADILLKAVENTVELLKKNIEVE